MQPAGVQRSDGGPVDGVRAVQMQPASRRSVPGFAALGDEDAERTPQPADRELDGGAAGTVQPLSVVDGDDHRRVRGQCMQHRHQPGRHDPLVGRGSVQSRAQQNAVQGQALQPRQVREVPRFQIAQQVSQRRERHHRLRLADARRQHPASAVARLAQQRPPQRGLADPGLSFDDQPGGPRCCGSQEAGNLRVLGG